MNKKIIFGSITTLLIATILFFTLTNDNFLNTKQSYKSSELIAKTAALIKENYVTEANPEKLFDGAFSNMGKSLDYLSAYLNKKQAQKLNNIDNMGYCNFKFIIKYGFPIVTHTNNQLEEKVKKGDIVKLINNKSTFNTAYSNIKYMLIDKLNKELNLVLMRGKNRKRIKLKVKMTKNPYKITPHDNFMIVRPFFITDDKEISEIKQKIINSDSKYIILDLRNLFFIKNEKAFKFAKLFLNKETKLKFQMNNSIKNMVIKPTNTIIKKEIILTVDYQTFEEGELIAYTLKKDGKKIVGQKTAGKSGLLYPIDYNDGSRFILLTGIIKKLYDKGIKPDIELKENEFTNFFKNPEKYLNGQKL